MARIKIEIDTDKASLEGVETLTSPAIAPVSPKPMVLVSTITLTRDLKQDFEAGAGQRPLYKDGVDYDDLPTVLQTYDGANRLIITTGGLVAFNAARDTLTTAYFVSLVGAVPQGNQGRCLGGVTVSGWNANSARVDFLAAKGRSRAGIGLFCNPKSAMNQAEETNWATIQGVNQTILHGGGSGGRNNPNHYPAEIAHANTAGITTLVISADPFFFHSREKLIKAANEWVAGAAAGTRYVCYPFHEYGNTGGQNQPTAGTASWYGGSLPDAYSQIGVTAALQLNSTNPIGFTAVPDTWGDF